MFNRLHETKFNVCGNISGHNGIIWSSKILRVATFGNTIRTVKFIIGTMNLTFQRRLCIGSDSSIVGDELNMIFCEQGISRAVVDSVETVLERHQEHNQERQSVILNDSQENMIDEGQASVNDENY